MMEYFKLVLCSSELDGHTFQGIIMGDLFTLLSTLLDSSDDWPILAGFDNNSPETSTVDIMYMYM